MKQNVMLETDCEVVSVASGYVARDLARIKNLSAARWIKLKGLLFLVLGLSSFALLLALHFDLVTALLFAIAFYVIEKYVEDRFRFSGLGSFMCYLVTGRIKVCESNPAAKPSTSSDDEPPKSPA